MFGCVLMIVVFLGAGRKQTKYQLVAKGVCVTLEYKGKTCVDNCVREFRCFYRAYNIADAGSGLRWREEEVEIQIMLIIHVVLAVVMVVEWEGVVPWRL